MNKLKVIKSEENIMNEITLRDLLIMAVLPAVYTADTNKVNFRYQIAAEVYKIVDALLEVRQDQLNTESVCGEIED